MMKPRERILATFEGRSTDRVPVHHIGFSGYAASVILGREAYVGGQIQQWREMKALWEGPEAHREFLERSERDAVDVALACGHDIIRLQYWRWRIKPTKKLNDYAFLFGDPQGRWYVLEFDPKTELFHRIEGYGESVMEPPEKEMSEEDLEAFVSSKERELEGYHPPQGPDPAIQATLAKYRDYAIRNWGVGASIPHDQVWLEAVALRPDLVKRYVEVQTERAVRQLPRLAASGVKLIFGGGDFASNEGPLYSPKVFRDIMLPSLKRITEECHRLGMYYLFASDGNLWPVADDLFGESGVDGYYEIDRRAGMDLRKLRERFPDLTLIGNISSHTLHRGTKEQVIKEVLSCIDVAQRYGRVIVGVSNYIMPGTPPQNIEALLETIERYR